VFPLDDGWTNGTASAGCDLGYVRRLPDLGPPFPTLSVVMRRLAWVTTRAAHGQDTDEPLALAALAEAGVQVDVAEWDDGGVDWSSYDRAVLRSTWDYAERLPEFLEWLERVAGQTELRNPLPMVRWSLDKHYLAELATAGVPVGVI